MLLKSRLIIFRLAIFLIGVLMTVTAQAAESIPKLGYVPRTFPRDIVKINQFSEHLLLGQILEPLVDADRFGKMTRGIAESWTVSPNGEKITFKLDKDKVFSNGKPIRAEDVKYSIERHIKERTQSSNFLKSIKDIEAKGKYEVVVVLNESNVAILKALSRDHLGIVPKGWTFDPESKEPYVGSGPYRLRKENGKWLLVKNDLCEKGKGLSVPSWELVYFKDDASLVLDETIPDYVPMATQAVYEDLRELAKKRNIELTITDQESFVQTSLWWYPHGSHYSSATLKIQTMSFLDELVERRTKEKHLRRATGIVPVGIAGYLPEHIHFKAKKVAPLDNQTLTPVTVAVMGAYDFIFDGEEAKKLAASYGLKLDHFNFSASELGALKEKKPDVVMAGWAGGFNDPEGFLPLLNQLLGVDFVEYLGDLRPLYLSARVEQDWSRRSELFREFNKKIVEERRMTPGWKVPMYAISKSGLTEENVGFRYTPRLANVKRIKK